MYTKPNMTRNMSVHYSLNELTMEVFEDIEKNEYEAEYEESTKSLFDRVIYATLAPYITNRCHSAGVYTFCYYNYKRCNSSIIKKVSGL